MNKWKEKSKHRMDNNQANITSNSSALKKMLIIVIIIFLLFDGLIYWYKAQPKTVTKGSTQIEEQANNISMIDGKQVITLTAKGGYSPRKSIAKAGISTILKVSTNGTFDCSSSIRIPALNLSKNLPTTGETDIDLGEPKVGLFKGTCGMGMYPFEIDFQS